MTLWLSVVFLVVGSWGFSKCWDPWTMDVSKIFEVFCGVKSGEGENRAKHWQWDMPLFLVICCPSRIQGVSSYSTRKQTFEFEQVHFFKIFKHISWLEHIATSLTSPSCKLNLLKTGAGAFSTTLFWKVKIWYRGAALRASSWKAWRRSNFDTSSASPTESWRERRRKILEKTWGNLHHPTKLTKLMQWAQVGKRILPLVGFCFGELFTLKLYQWTNWSISSQACIVHLREIDQLTPVEKITG